MRATGESRIDLFTGLSAVFSTGEKGTIEGTFGQSGKVKVRVMEGLQKETIARVGTGKKKTEQQSGDPVTVTVNFKRYVFDPDKKIIKV